MSLSDTRKILGDDNAKVSYEDIQKEIEVADLLKSTFFSLLHKKLGKLKK